MEKGAVFQMNDQAAQAGRKVLSELEKMCEKPRENMEKLLLKILEDNKNTEYGKKYRFDQIHSFEDYRKSVPIITYDDIAEQIERMKNGEKSVLTAYSFNHMNLTSATVGKHKAIPLTKEQIDVFAKYNNILISGILEKELGDSWKNGRSFCTSEGNHVKLESGITVGCASSVMADVCKGGVEPYSSMLKTLFTSPLEAMSPGSETDTRYMHVRFALSDGEITGITSGFSTTVIMMLDYIRKNYELLINDIEKGTIDESISMSEDSRNSLLKQISPMPERAQKLREIFSKGADFPFVPQVWPKLQYITCIGGSSFSVYDEYLEDYFTAGKVHRLYYGVTSSEGLWSVPVSIDDLNSVIVPDSAVMEFLPVEAGDDFSQMKLIDELEEGKIYELFITNLCGLYRYRMSDAVKVTGFFHKTPTVQFMYRVNKTLNLVGEKTTEEEMRITAFETAKELGFSLIDFEVYPDTQAIPPKYVFLLEAEDDTPSKISREDLERVVLEQICKASDEFAECYEEKLISAPDCYFEQAQTQLLYAEKQIFLGASRSQIKPLHILSTDEQIKFFKALRNLW